MTLGMKYDEFKREGLEEGRAEGIQQNRFETARIALQNNIPIEMIQKLTHLSEAEILAL